MIKDSNTREEADCDASVEHTGLGGSSDQFPSYNEQSSDDYLVHQQSASEVEDVSASVGEISIPLGSTDQLADVLSKKIDMTVSLLIEEKLFVVVDRIVTEKIKGILANIR